MNLDNMKVLSMWQPWATLCVARDKDGVIAKPDETRSWSPNAALPVTVAIHATAKWDTMIRESCKRFEQLLAARGYSATARGRENYIGNTRALEPLPLGQIIGVAVVVACWPTEFIYPLHTEARPPHSVARSASQLELGDYSHNRFAWVLSEQIELPEPVPFRGKQARLYSLRGEARDRVRSQFKVIG